MGMAHPKGDFSSLGDLLLVPLSFALGFTHLDVECKVFYYAEDFFQVLSIGLCRWARNLMELTGIATLSELLHYCKNTSQVYKPLYFLLYYVGPYWVTRCAIKS